MTITSVSMLANGTTGAEYRKWRTCFVYLCNRDVFVGCSLHTSVQFFVMGWWGGGVVVVGGVFLTFY